MLNFFSGHTGSLQLPVISFGSIYMKLWQGMKQLERDPYPSVREMCHRVLEKVRAQAREIASNRETETRGSSVSLPPSPSSRSSYLT